MDAMNALNGYSNHMLGGSIRRYVSEASSLLEFDIFLPQSDLVTFCDLL